MRRLSGAFFARLSLLSLLILPLAARGAVYDVGPGFAYQNVGDVPFAKLLPGDAVNIHGRALPYRERVLLSFSGSPGSPIIFQGVPGLNGEPAVFDFKDATTSKQFVYARGNANRGGIFVSRDRMVPGHGYGYSPHDIVIRNLTLRGAYLGDPTNPNTFYDQSGAAVAHAVNAAGVAIEMGSRITLENLDISDCNNGVEVWSNGDPEQSYDIAIRYCKIYNCGTAFTSPTRTPDRDHITYTEGCRVEYDHCTLGPPRPGSGGSSLKDRSVGLWVHDCTIIEGAHSLDIVDPEGSAWFVKNLPEFQQPARIENNLIINTTATYPVHFGGDKGQGVHHPTVLCTGNRWFLRGNSKPLYRIVLIKNDTPTRGLFIGETWNVGGLTPGTAPTLFYLHHNEYSVVDMTTGKVGSIEFIGGTINGKVDTTQTHAPANRSTNYEGNVLGLGTLTVNASASVPIPPVPVLVPPVSTVPPPVVTTPPTTTTPPVSTVPGTSTSTVLTAPTGLMATLSGTSVALNWTNGTGPANQWRVYRSSDGGKTFILIVSSQTILTSITDSPGSGNFVYKIQARSKTASGETTIFSSPVSVTVP